MSILAILAGGGRLPTLLANKALEKGNKVVLLTFTGQPQPEIPAGADHVQLALGAVSKTIKTLRQHKVEEVALAGYFPKPSLFDVRPDAKGLAILARLARHHDDELFSAICTFLQEEGFKVVAVPEIAPDLMAPAGVLGQVQPDRAANLDIELGRNVLAHMAPLDISQAVIVKDKVVLGVEAAEGTEGLIKRCAPLRGEANAGGVLIKMAKAGQNVLVDLPSVGPRTIEQLIKGKYKGLAVHAGKTLMLDREAMLKQADEQGLFIIGIKEKP
jgi:hypothetical protein